MHKEEKYLVLLIAALFVIFLYFNFLSPVLLWDENAYLGNARSHISTSNYTENFRFPLLEWIISIVWLVTGESIFAARLTMIFMALGTVLLTYLISKHFFEKEGFWITVIFSLSYPFLVWGFRAYTEIAVLLFTLLAFYMLIKEKPFFAGVFAALAFLSKFTAALFAVSVLLFFLINKGSNRKKAVYFAGAFVITLLPWLACNCIIHGNPVWDFTEQYKIVEAYTVAEPYTNGIEDLSYSLIYLIFFLPIGIIALIKGKNRNYLALAGIYLLLFCLYFIGMANVKFPRYFLAIAPLLIMVSYEGIKSVTRRANKFFSLMIILLILISVFIGLNESLKEINRIGECDREGAIIQSINYLKPAVNESDTIVSNYWPFFGYYLNTKISSTWTENVSRLIEMHSPKYIVLNDRLGLETGKAEYDNSSRLELEKIIIGKCGEETRIYKVKSL